MQFEVNPMDLAALFVVLACAFGLNVPLGYLRSRQRKFSWKWFLFIHLSVPLMYWLRISAGLGYWAIPFEVAAAVAGQIVGGRFHPARQGKT